MKFYLFEGSKNLHPVHDVFRNNNNNTQNNITELKSQAIAIYSFVEHAAGKKNCCRYSSYRARGRRREISKENDVAFFAVCSSYRNLQVGDFVCLFEKKKYWQRRRSLSLWNDRFFVTILRKKNYVIKFLILLWFYWKRGDKTWWRVIMREVVMWLILC